MKACQRVLMLPVALTAVSHGDGILLYHDPPSDYVEIYQYTSIETGMWYTQTVLTNKKEREFKNAGVLAIIAYPSNNAGLNSESLAAKSIQMATMMETKYPQYKAWLTDLVGKWQNALQVAAQAKRQKAAAPRDPNAISFVTTRGIRYDSAQVSASAQEIPDHRNHCLQIR